MGGTVDEIAVHEVREHVHRALPDLVHVDVESREGGADDIGVFGSDEGEDLDVLGDGRSRSRRS